MSSLFIMITNKLEGFWKWITCDWLKKTNRQGISIAEERGERVETQPSARINSDTSQVGADDSHEAQQRQERWEESLRILGNERVQIMNEYSSLSLRSNDELDSELSRIAVESRRAEELFENKLMEARDAIARVFEEHRRRRREKLAKFFEIWRNEEWSRQAEMELSSRLNLLRNAHEPVRRRFMNLTVALLDQSQGSDPKISYLHVMGELTLLKDELRSEITTMNDEVVDMQEFKIKYPQAKFLTDIEESAQRVADAAVILLSNLKGAVEELKSVPDGIISVAVLNDCQQCFDELEKQVEDIPTVLVLKEKYQNNI